MKNFREKPFLNKDFSPRGGGIDYLGMRWVNLTILGDWLIPGINNVTGDVGTYALGAWIPWKFQELCRRQHKDFNELAFRRFRESVEVCMSEVMKDGTQSTKMHGVCINRMGARQQLEGDSLTFKAVGRSDSTSVYAPVQYGPSLRAIGLLAGYAADANGGATAISLSAEDPDTQLIIRAVEDRLRTSSYYALIDSLDQQAFGRAEIEELGLHGLHPGCYVDDCDEFAHAFLRKLCPAGSQNGRALTGRLIVETLHQKSGLDATELRDAWYTGLLPSGVPLTFAEGDEALLGQCSHWAVFMGRQYQRYIVELFMRCFELALVNGARSVADAVEYAFDNLADTTPRTSSFYEVRRGEAERLQAGLSTFDASRTWSTEIHGAHPLFEGTMSRGERQTGELDQAFVMLARWSLRTTTWMNDSRKTDLLSLGGRNRMGMQWFGEWVAAREDLSLKQMLHDLFSEIVFSQHLRIAISRLDGDSQRLRFVLGDHGIEPTTGFAKKMGQGLPAWMQDRLGSFLRLLTDLQVIQLADDGYALGARSGYIRRLPSET